MSRTHPTVRRRRLGRELGVQRRRRGLTLDQVVALAQENGHRTSRAVLSRVERGEESVTPRVLAALFDIYEVEGGRRRALEKLVRSAQQRGWWLEFDSGLSSGYIDLIALEEDATGARVWDMSLIHGLLQTEEYAHSFLRLASDASMSIPEIETRVRVRMERQRVLAPDRPEEREPLRVWSVIDEAALRRPVGGLRVMKRQIEHLIELSERPTVSLQVLPFDSGAHIGQNGAFSLYEFDGLPPLVYIETMLSDLYEEDDAVDRYRRSFEDLRANALPFEKTRDTLARLAREL